MAAQTIEQFLVEQLEKVAPRKYTLASVLQLFKNKLRFPCSHLKGGRSGRLPGLSKDYNLSIFTFPTGVTEIKCLYNCGLKIRSDQPELVSAFNELYDFPTTNRPAKAEEQFYVKGGKRVSVDPGPVPVYSDEYRQRIKDSNDSFIKYVERGLESGRIKPGDTILGGVFPHPDPIEAPDTLVERGILESFVKANSKKPLSKATAVAQDSIPATENPRFPTLVTGVCRTAPKRYEIPSPTKSNKKIRKSRKANQSRQRKRSGSKGRTQ